MKTLFTLMTVALLGASGGMFYYQIKLFFVNRSSVEAEEFANTFVEGIQVSKTILEEKLQEKTDRVIDLQYSLNSQKEKNTDLSKKLSAKVSESLELKSEIRRLKSGIENIRESYDKLNQETNQVNEDYLKLKDDYSQLKRSFETIESQNKSQKILIENTRDLNFSSDKTCFTVAQIENDFKRKKKDQGNILKYDKEFNLLVIDLGKIDGLNRGSVLNIVRQDKRVSQVRIEKVFPYFSSGVLIGRFVDVQAGDQVSFS